MHLGNQWREPMKSAEETTTLKKRVTWAKEHWRLFFSEMPLREKNLQSVTQTLETKGPDFNKDRRQADST
jgi:hypothetical protein